MPNGDGWQAREVTRAPIPMQIVFVHWAATGLLAFAIAFVGSMPIAGPIAVLVVLRAGQGRAPAALAIACGSALAEACYAAVSFLAFSTLLAHNDSLSRLAHGISAALLLAIGARCACFTEADFRPTSPNGRREESRTFLLGLSISSLNPTLLLTWSAAVAFLHARGLVGQGGLDALPFGAGVALGVIAWNTVLVRTIAHYRGRMPRRVFVWAIRCMGMVVAAAGAWSAIQFIIDWRSSAQPTTIECRALAGSTPWPAPIVQWPPPYSGAAAERETLRCGRSVRLCGTVAVHHLPKGTLCSLPLRDC